MPFESEQLGQQGVIAIGIGIFCLSFYAGSVAPLAAERDRLRGEADRLTQSIKTAKSGATGPTQQKAVATPPVSTSSDLLEKLAEAGSAAGFVVDRAAMHQTDQDGLRRIDIAFSLKGEYPKLRDALRAYMSISPVATLDELALRRANSKDLSLEATVRLTNYFTLP